MINKKNKMSVTFFSTIGHFHGDILCNKIDRVLNLGHLKQNFKAIALPFFPKLVIFMWKLFATRFSAYNRVLVIRFELLKLV